MSILLGLINRNLPLHLCAKVKADGTIDDIPSPQGKGWTSYKKLKTVAQAFVNSCSHSAVVEQLAKEWKDLPAELKLEIREIANFGGWRSGNVTKGLSRLHKATGDIYRRSLREDERVFVKQEGKDSVAFRKKKLEAIIAAQRAHAPFKLPPNYESMTPTQKNQWRQQAARDRRGGYDELDEW